MNRKSHQCTFLKMKSILHLVPITEINLVVDFSEIIFFEIFIFEKMMFLYVCLSVDLYSECSGHRS